VVVVQLMLLELMVVLAVELAEKLDLEVFLVDLVPLVKETMVDLAFSLIQQIMTLAQVAAVELVL
jgi:hypothetical protein